MESNFLELKLMLVYTLTNQITIMNALAPILSNQSREFPDDVKAEIKKQINNLFTRSDDTVQLLQKLPGLYHEDN